MLPYDTQSYCIALIRDTQQTKLDEGFREGE